MVELTDNAKAVLLEMYKQYLEKEDLDLPDANEFPETFSDTCNVFGKPKPNTVNSALDELKEADFIKTDILGTITLKNKGIAYMDNSYHHNIANVVSAIASIFSSFK